MSRQSSVVGSRQSSVVSREKETEDSRLKTHDFLSIVICEIGSKKIGFVVDRFLGQQEVVIKTLREPLKNMKGIAGATILGDGRVAMIADIASMI